MGKMEQKKRKEEVSKLMDEMCLLNDELMSRVFDENIPPQIF